MFDANFFKSSFIKMTNENTRIIDMNALAAKRIAENSSVLRELPEDCPEPQYDEEGNLIEPSGIDALTEDTGSETFSEGGDEETYANDLSLDPADIRNQCDEMIAEANEEADRTRNEAKAEAEGIRASAHEEGYNAGYEEGTRKAAEELEAIKAQLSEERAALQAEYEMALAKAEPEMVDTITKVYEHVFGLGFYNRRDVLVTLINKALLQAEGEETVIIYVSPDDYEGIISMRERLLDKVSLPSDPEIRERDDLTAGSARVETAFGIMDCSIDTELKELNLVLRILSYEGSNEK